MYYIICIHVQVEIRLDNNNNELGCNDDEEKKKLLYLLTKHGVSFEFYHELTMMYPHLVRSYKVRKQINTCFAVNYIATFF